jgi:hypothetical protein
VNHQDRVRQNYCEHEFPYMHMEFIRDFPDIPDGRKCIKCGIDYDKAVRVLVSNAKLR